jgi:hypothetical protein
MNDQDDDETIEHEGGAGEQPTTAPPAEVYGAVLALIGVIQNPRAFKSKLKEFRQAEAAANKAAAGLATARATHDQHCASERADTAAKAEAVHKREVAVFVRENVLKDREDAALEVERAWGSLLESEAVRSGFQSAEFAPLEKARRWISGLNMTSSDDDVHADVDTSVPMPDGNDADFSSGLPPDATIARASQTPPRSAAARRSMRRAMERY